MNTTFGRDRDLQDKLITYLADASVRRQTSSDLPISPQQAQRANRFARFLARRYYRDRLVRSFRYSQVFAAQLHRSAEEIVDGKPFDSFLNECVLGSFESAQRVGKMAVAHLTISPDSAPGPWWPDLLEYERCFFLQAATAENSRVTSTPFRGISALCCQFAWNLPDLLAKVKNNQPITDDQRVPVTLLFSRTREGRIYVVEVDEPTKAIFQTTDGLRSAADIAGVTSLPETNVGEVLESLVRIGAVVRSSN